MNTGSNILRIKIKIMNSHFRSFCLFFTGLLAVMLTVTSCNKDDYYTDGGISNGKFNGTIPQYLASKPAQFDTLVSVIKLAGMEQIFSEEKLTFFAPPDNCFKRLINSVNPSLFRSGKDTIKTLDEIPASIWRKYLTLYLFKGANKQKDYPQVDLSARNIFPGQNTRSYDGDILNIGVFYNDAGTTQTGIVKYAGFRQLYLSFIPNTAQPFESWNTVRISSSDIEPLNGVVHALYADHTFSFDANNFYLDLFSLR
jgi:uncharacterized surface protein with fasciclin (FAS1) repeats